LVWALAGGVVIAAIVVLGALFELGPFSKPELTSGELIARGDGVCREAHQAFTDLQEQPPQTSQQAAELTGQLLGIANDELDRIAELNGPPEFDAELDSYLEARRRGIEALEEGHQAARDGDDDAYTAAQEKLADSQRDRRELAREIGFAVCSRSLQG
jgi:hypothetical protein